ncbi:MAG: hypothetical protein Kow0062_10400 [Acidobacteriota bacterium]
MARAERRARADRDPLQVNLRRLVRLLLLLVIVPTFLLTGLALAMLATRQKVLDLIFGLILLAFAASVVAGGVLIAILAGRGARIAQLQSTFLSRMSHELRTPLAGIQLHAQILEATVHDDAARDSARAIARETARLTELVDRLLRWREVRKRTHLYRTRPVHPGEIVEQVRRDLGESAPLEVRLRGPLPPVIADPEAIAEAIRNLVHNALKYAPGETPRLDVRRLGRSVVFAVSDRGPGLPPGTARERLFEPFVRRVDRSRPDPGGSGVGLAIARQIVRAHGGRLAAMARPGGGSRFVILLPARGDH